MSDTPGRGMTTREVAELLRVSGDKVLGWIRSGRLAAVNTASVACGRPRYVILPQHLDNLIRTMAAESSPPAPRPRRRARQSGQVDYYP